MDAAQDVLTTSADNQSTWMSALTLLLSSPQLPEPTTTRAPEILLPVKRLPNGLCSPPQFPSPVANWINSDESNPAMLDASKPETVDRSISSKSLPNVVMVLWKEMKNVTLVLPTLTLPPMLAEEIANSHDVVMVSKIRVNNVTELPTVPKLVLSIAQPPLPELRETPPPVMPSTLISITSLHLLPKDLPCRFCHFV
jgi:hypothetical protein